MTNESKCFALRIGLVTLLVGLLLLLTGNFAYKMGKESAKKQDIELQQALEPEVSVKDVQAFLKAYTTKEQDGANRKAYRPFMTEKMYNEETTKEDAPDRKQFGAFMVDYKYQNADIYRSLSNTIVLVKVDYTLTYLKKANNYENAQKGIKNTLQLKLTYVKENGKYLIDRIDPVNLDDVTSIENEDTSAPIMMP